MTSVPEQRKQSNADVWIQQIRTALLDVRGYLESDTDSLGKAQSYIGARLRGLDDLLEKRSP